MIKEFAANYGMPGAAELLLKSVCERYQAGGCNSTADHSLSDKKGCNLGDFFLRLLQLALIMSRESYFLVQFDIL